MINESGVVPGGMRKVQYGGKGKKRRPKNESVTGDYMSRGLRTKEPKRRKVGV